jgi:hypothetical protein
VRKSQFNWLSPLFSVFIRSDTQKVAGQTAQDTVGSVRDGTRNIDNELGITEDLGARVIDGACIILKIFEPS